MAVGDEAQAAGYSIVPDTDLVKDGAEEINRSRDYIAQVKVSVPTGKAAYRTAAGITSGTAAPSGGNDGDIYFQIIS
jgi:hypothetical protein